MKIELTDQQEQAVKEGRPVEVRDPQTDRALVVLARELFERVRSILEGGPGSAAPAAPGAVPSPAEGQPRVKVRDLPMPPEVAEAVKQRCKKLGCWRRGYVHEVEDRLKLQHYFGGKYVGCLPSDEGPIVVAAGLLESEAFDRQLAALTAEERQQVLLEAVDPWNDHTSLILSPSSIHEG